MTPLFITGIGTDVGKTVTAAVIAQALQAPYWKPVQAGNDGLTDKQVIQQLTTGVDCFDERYSLKMPASPHIAAREEGIHISISDIVSRYHQLVRQTGRSSRYMVIEGAGGLYVPLNEKEFVIDLVEALDAKVILVSRNYLGSINHSLLSAMACREKGLNVCGWLFNDQYLQYENEIAEWSGYPVLGQLPHFDAISKEQVMVQAQLIQQSLRQFLP